jgi:F-type H+-transporting ATPase subunit gamma
LLDDFKNGLIDEVYVIYTFMRSAFKLEPTVMKLLPLDIGSFERTEVTEGDTKFGMQYTLFYLPTPEAVLESLVPKYVKGIVYGALVESFTSENSARMTAMENATTNADKMLEKLRMFYNRTRQAVITQEISEIIGGANMIDE